MIKLWVWLFKFFGWKVTGEVPYHLKKCVVVVGPHTSFWDFMVGVPARAILGLESKYFIKSDLCKGPLGKLLIKLGAIPVDRKKNNTRLVDLAINEFNAREELIIAVTPEGTRSYSPKWKSGFWHIARGANIPIIMIGFCFKRKEVVIGDYFMPSDDKEADILKIKTYLSDFTGKHPEKGILKSEL
ncbi:1-acyl-sn-glycerol-3-phosphate acyltransferase [Flammeovirga yaeyamensis]|uniref:1-acyl-sn-glycerol-3-phosphate acyltransferase n=1 Tax=Flammeovirga yaeyamensis TaxID=367791 RepID=A0AAX1MZH2_9BACT|nr:MULTISPECIES: 1-acyl-sn-glycerol-3-phosphate acyltransferase [Flammeovirga]ANQ47967.1 acyltransferase [Flammeovirga sp. MY04]MBB3700871.1 1-acyl-sn-glycerol-3-phosphate acyltransferase [Flammeovirga yaeyamensis]NMF37979.1 acyltransferase [Flammeovirga yaeyamensis]QWG00630.1 1-acyl-sn-glycerol-3-phosphate acyltransferase [Flammeovirga yaeyamensis]